MYFLNISADDNIFLFYRVQSEYADKYYLKKEAIKTLTRFIFYSII